MSEIREIPVPKAASSQAIFDLLRYFINVAAEREITSIRVDALIDGKHEEMTITVK